MTEIKWLSVVLGKLGKAGEFLLEMINAVRKAVGKGVVGFERLIQAGKILDKSGLSAAGRALKKHGDRIGSKFLKAKGTLLQINEQGEKVLQEILTNQNVVFSLRRHARFGKIAEYKIPGGMGVRFNFDNNTLIGFIEP